MSTSTVSSPAPEEPRHDPALGAAFGLGSVVFFTANVLLVRYAGESLAVGLWWALIIRYLFALAFTGAVFGPQGGLHWKRLFTQKLLVWRGLLGGLGILIAYIGIYELGAGRTTLLINTYPLFAAILAAIYLKEPLNLKRVGWIVTAIAGLVLLTGLGGDERGFGAVDALVLASAAVAGVVVVMVRHLHRTETSATIFSAQAFYGLVLALPFFGLWPSEPPSVAGWILSAITGVLVAGGQLLMTRGYRYLRVADGATLQLLVPVCTATGGVLLLGETYTPLEVVGAVLTLVGCAGVVRAKKAPLLRRKSMT